MTGSRRYPKLRFATRNIHCHSPDLLGSIHGTHHFLTLVQHYFHVGSQVSFASGGTTGRCPGYYKCWRRNVPRNYKSPGPPECPECIFEKHRRRVLSCRRRRGAGVLCSKWYGMEEHKKKESGSSCAADGFWYGTTRSRRLIRADDIPSHTRYWSWHCGSE